MPHRPPFRLTGLLLASILILTVVLWWMMVLLWTHRGWVWLRFFP